MVADILQEIYAQKRRDVEARQEQTPLNVLEDQVKDLGTPKSLIKALRQKVEGDLGLGVIAEIKKASPSKGVIREDFQPVEHAKSYVANGAAALSVLTDTPYFQGGLDVLQAVRSGVDVPLLQKDFVYAPYQVFEARSLGADAILLIMAMLDIEQAKELESVAHSLNMDVLVEVHNMEELELTLQNLNSTLVGINNRNLRDFTVSIATSQHLNNYIPAGYDVVAESGIKDAAIVKTLVKSGIRRFLIGEQFMKSDEPGRALGELLKNAGDA